ncbi:MAG: EamA family transporter, partial [Mailhella sp.]|nr:EamA family transporter [Mailhella sp.]
VFGAKRPSGMQCAGLLLGSAGAMTLGVQQGSVGAGSAFGMVCIALNIAGWVAGSFVSKRTAGRSRLTVMQSTALMLMTGGLQLLAVSLMLGERCDWPAVTAEGWTSLCVLIMFGGITAYACYFWLLANTGTAVAISYDYASPIVGMLLSHFVTGEEIGLLKAGTCAVILTALTLVVCGEKRSGR